MYFRFAFDNIYNVVILIIVVKLISGKFDCNIMNINLIFKRHYYRYFRAAERGYEEI